MAKKTAKNSTKTWVGSVVARFDGTIAEQPLAAANKAVLAGLGFATQFQTNVETKYDEFAHDGEKVRDQIEGSLESLQKRVFGQVKSRRDEFAKGAESALNTVLGYAPIARSSDIDKLNAKIDKVLLQVAK
jgi:polyhydroxyalkanoate synthesis regulator phasin